jgi:hypothetical protein
MTYALRKRPRSNDFDLVDQAGKAIGQVVASDTGFAVYLFGDFERLFDPSDSAEAALEAFEDWAASNTVSNVLLIQPADEAREL